MTIESSNDTSSATIMNRLRDKVMTGALVAVAPDGSNLTVNRDSFGIVDDPPVTTKGSVPNPSHI